MSSTAKRALGVTAAGAAGVACYAGQYPTSQLYGRTICRERAVGKLIALTYDDGPNPRMTPKLMEVLERHGAKATFLLIGKWAEREPELIRETVAAGHAIGNHTFTHPRMALRTMGQLREDLQRCREAIEAAGVEISTVDGRALMRPPYGTRRPATLRVLKQEGYVPLLWSITCYDWRRTTTTPKLVRRALRARDGDIILFHDGYHKDPAHDRTPSIEATDEVLGRMTGEGYRFVTVPDLVGAARGG